MNHVEMMGCIVNHDLRYTPKGLPILETTLAGHTGSIWYQRITLIGKIAERMADLPIGDVLYTQGKLQHNRWTTKDGHKRSSVKMLTARTEVIDADLTRVNDARGQPILQDAIQEVTLAGNVTHDVDVKDTGKAQLAKASIAVNERKQQHGEWVDDTHFFELVAWEGTPAFEALQAAGKGSSLVVRGMLHGRSWEGADGRKRYATDIKSSVVLPIGKLGDASRLDIDVGGFGDAPF